MPNAKPILLARIHKGATLEIQEKVSIKLCTITCGEYHVMVINSLRKDDIVLEVLNADKLNPIDINDLKVKIIKYITS